jgi:hypothetical protein
VDLLRKSLVGVVVVGLAVDAYVHLKLASSYDGGDWTITEGELFRFEAVLAIVSALLLLFRPNRVTAGIAALVAGGGTAALLFYYFVNLGAVGPFPPMYEPIWHTEKVVTLVAQIAATAAAVILVVIGVGRQRAVNGTPVADVV